MSRATNINPAILKWARESAGLDAEEAAKRIGLTDNKNITAAEKLVQFEDGQQFPTKTQVGKIASVYRRPLITFYMQNPPARGDRGEDFRRTASTVTRRENALLDSLLRDIRARQEMVKEILTDEGYSEANLFVGSLSVESGVQSLVDAISHKIGFDYRDITLRRGDADALFKRLRAKAEDAGVFVLLIGNLGSHHSALSADVFRGFAIADKIAPFVVINDQDARAARSFTLIHELAHIGIGQSGVSSNPSPNAPATPHERIESFCNDVAGEFLLPNSSLGNKPDSLNQDDKDAAHTVIQGIATQWSVSEAMVAYRLNRIGWITPSIYGQLLSDYEARWRLVKQKTRDDAREDEGGPSYYVVKQSKLGNALIEVVRRSLRENLLTHTKAAKVLGVKPSSVEPLVQGYEQSRGAVLFTERGTT